jgi:tRNA modification GTPase
MLDLLLGDTIAALATPSGAAGAGVVRLAGPQTIQVVGGLFEARSAKWKSASRPVSVEGEVWIPGDQLRIPARLTLWPTNRSYCGQPQAEISLVACQPLLEATLAECFRHGARGAQPGEFTLRAYLNGKVDLLQAEAVLGVIDARHEDDLRVALSQLGGGVSRPLTEVRDDLLNLLADVEAGLDFVDEDIEFVSRTDVATRLGAARAILRTIEQQSSHRMTSNARRRVVLAGLPNAGKSTLLNRLAATDAALVSQIAGTTRDYLVWAIHWEGLSFDLIDTAGWEVSDQPISKASQKQREEQMRVCDLLVWCSAADATPEQRRLDDQLLREVDRDSIKWNSIKTVRIVTKIDRHDPTLHPLPKESPLGLSAVTGEGLDRLATVLRGLLVREDTRSQVWLGTTAARCRESLAAAGLALESALSASSRGDADELLSADLRQAVDALGLITGEIRTDDLLDRIFSRFCIGK